jgi:2-desacetyl-2-hydroxyethyl bacteriochlorophyllide A dehydrogenase
MRAALLESPGHMVMTEASMPIIDGADQVLIQVRTVGVCGSEIHAFHGTHPYRIAPVILGHEVAGDVVAVAEGVSNYAVGDRVVVDPQWTCGECIYCRTGYINHCPNKMVLGTHAWPGGFGEYILAQEKAVFRLPETLSYKQGSLIEPLTVGIHVVKQAGLAAGESVAILGTGSIGGLLSGVCRVYGAGPIITADIRQHCLDAARERLGATHDFLLPDDNFVDKVKEVSGGEGVDVTFVTADDVSLVNRAVEMTKPRGRIVLVALLTDAPLQMKAYDIIGKELHIVGSTMTHHADMREAIELAASGQVDVEAIATHVLPVEEAQRGMELVDTKDDGAIKVVLSFS